MAMILQVIFAVCCFVEIISARPTLSPNDTNTFERELMRLNRTLTACGEKTAKTGKGCGRIQKIDFFNPKESVLCQKKKYQSIFGQVSCALKNITYNDCNNTDIITELQKNVDVLSGDHNVTCSNGSKKTTMNEFCPGLKKYVNRLQEVCLK